MVDKLPENNTFVGSTTTQLSEQVFRYAVAAVGFDGHLDVRWVRATEHNYNSGLCDVAYDSEVACDEQYVFVVRGSALVALDRTRGDDKWAAPLDEIGGAPTLQGKTVPMVSKGLVVISTGGGTAAFQATTGRLAWFFPNAGARAVYGDRLHLVTSGEYYVLDLPTGCFLLEAALAAAVEEEWSLSGVQFSTHLAVSETHGFIGDSHGRLYAFERLTGEPVWMDQPEGISGFSGNIPVIVDNRLYISSFSMAPAPPPRLYCYEGLT